MQRLGDGALRLARPARAPERALLDAVRRWPGVVDACVTEQWVAVYFADDTLPTVDQALVAALDSLEPAGEAPRLVEIPVRYDGADLDAVARECNLSTARVRELHAGATYAVAFLGFMPGFAYLVGLPRELEVPRLAAPRTSVPRNAVAIAGHYAGVYPFASSGGWRLLGTASQSLSLFDAERGAMLRPGDQVRFEEAP
jgi:UPF0271 protein